MSVNPSWFRMFLEMHRRLEFTGGNVMGFGVQDVMFTHEMAEQLCRERNAQFTRIPPPARTYHLSPRQRPFIDDPHHFMSYQDLFRLIGYRSLVTLDAFENDAPDVIWDLSQPIPEEWHNKYDLVVDIGVLEHTADIFQALENVGNLVKPGGYLTLYLPMVSPIYTCMYHPNPPFYFDVLSANGFDNITTWINWMPKWDHVGDIRTIWLNYRYNDDVEIWRSDFYTIMMCFARKAEHLGAFKPALQGLYKTIHAGVSMTPASDERTLRHNAGLSEVDCARQAQAKRSGFAREVMTMLAGEYVPASPWLYPTAQSEPTPEQLANFALSHHGVPHAPRCLIPPIDSERHSEIPEQMLVGIPPREQLYL